MMVFQNDSVTLNELNNEEVKRQIPLMIYLIVISMIGIVGNSLVCYVFAKNVSRSTYRIFVTFVSSVDLFTCCICLSLHFVMQFYRYTYDNKWICKISISMNTWTTMTSCFVLLCIAFDRFRKVCYPLNWQVSLKAAKYMCLASVGVGLACSWISAIIYDIKKEKHKVYNVTIFQCAVTDDMKETLFPFINNLTFAICFVGVFVVIFSFYSCIAVRIRRQMKWKHKGKDKIGTECSKDRIATEESKDRIDTEDSKDRIGTKDNRNRIKITTEMSYEMTEEQTGETLESEQDSNLNDTPGKRDKETDVKKRKFKASKNNRCHTMNRSNKYKTSKIMFMVSLAAIVSFAPVISLLLTRSLNKTFLESLDNTQRTVYNFFLRSYFINSAVNPLIYGILDVRFRSSCKRLFSCDRA
ncbi:D(2) dopamine receptor-like [Ruditapes philippinarum]|uniref:D(2) dopamine receptor-like n=1 Tax=Ruditapes philippinarum TaxID=129788 RepID=UPI00295B8CA4|nr:D(2) dopamine receptor-like [Ruditapes philippinarum]